jgi:putative transposase
LLLPYDQALYHRRSIRLPGYDYSQPGAYFVTIVTFNRERRFGTIKNNEVSLKPQGILVGSALLSLPKKFPFLQLDAWIIMPDHIHAILIILDPGSAGHPADMEANFIIARGTASQSLASLIQSYKSITTRKINSELDTRGSRVWHRNYYEHVIRNENELVKIRDYIENNPFHPDDEDVW